VLGSYDRSSQAQGKLLVSDWHNYELDLQLIFDLDYTTRAADWTNAEISLLDLRTAGVSSIFTPHICQDRPALAVKRQLTRDNPLVNSGLFELRGMKAYKRVAFTLQDLGVHGALDFRLLRRTQFVVLQKHQLASVNGKGHLRGITVIEAASSK
jgi:hypothetical protein